MPEPTSMEELAKRQTENYKVSGYGVEGVTNSFPCPFCGAPDWYVVKVLDFGQTSPSIKCEECGRSAKYIVSVEGGGKAIQVVQTGGPAQPDWMIPRMPVELQWDKDSLPDLPGHER